MGQHWSFFHALGSPAYLTEWLILGCLVALLLPLRVLADGVEFLPSSAQLLFINVLDLHSLYILGFSLQ